MTFAACSDDEKDYTPHYTICQHCDIPEEDGYEVCTGDNGNAYVGNADTGIETSHYFELFCDNVPEIPGGGGGTTYTDCVLCISDAHPEGVKICKGTNGNAFTFVGDTATDTGEAYATFLTSQNCTSAEPIEEDVPLTNCVTCMAEGINVGDICKGSNGHAYDGNTDTGQPYQDYINFLQMGGATCE
ncbi:hypothetical protein [Flavobacterium album]|nr:hypothetical protein [Flavobacterium album]